LLLGSFITSSILTKKKERHNFVFKKKAKREEIKICVEKKLKKHLSIAKKKTYY
jgi:hypothetical protein